MAVATLVSPVGLFPTKLSRRESKVVEAAVAASATSDASSVMTLTNKTIDGDLNTISDLAVGSLKTVIASADKVIAFATTTGVPAAVAVTGDVTMTGLGVTAIGANKVKPTMVAVADGTNGQVLTTNGAGQMSFAAQSLLQSSVSISLTQAEIIGLHNTSKQLIAAPAAGSALVVDSVEVYHNFDTAAYTGGGALSVQYGNTVAAGGTSICAPAVANVTGGADSNVFINPVVYAGPAGFALLAQAATGVFLSNADADFADGNAANIIKVVVKYRTIILAV